MVLLLFVAAFAASAAAQPAPRDVILFGRDGTRLSATHYAAAKPGPAVVLLHMCNTTRQSWDPAARQLSAAGISALTIDNRGFGESGGPRFEGASAETQRDLAEQWPGDFDSAFEWLVAQPGVDGRRIGVGGGSCGVNNAVKLASRHPEVRSLVLLAGGADLGALKYLEDNPWLPIFTAAAADDQYGGHFPELMRWFVEFTGNPRNRFTGFQDGRHGTEIFGPHPELVRQITTWFVDTLAKTPADSQAKFTPKRTAQRRSLGRGPAARRGLEGRAAISRSSRARPPRAGRRRNDAERAWLRQTAGGRRCRSGGVLQAERRSPSHIVERGTTASLTVIGPPRPERSGADRAAEVPRTVRPTIPEQFKADLRRNSQEKIAKLQPWSQLSWLLWSPSAEEVSMRRTVTLLVAVLCAALTACGVSPARGTRSKDELFREQHRIR